MANTKLLILLGLIVLLCLATPSHAFGAGNIASISKIEGHNWRHGDIEDMLATVACIKGHKWKSMMIKVWLLGDWRPILWLMYCSAYTLAIGFETIHR